MAHAAAAAQVPPQNIEVEESVLGALMVAAPTLERVIDEVRLRAGDFYLDKHRLIFECICELHRSSAAVDELTVSHALDDAGQLDAAGGRHYISELAAKVPAAANAKHYAEIILDCALRREKQRIGLELTNGLLPADAMTQLLALETRAAEGVGDGVRTVTFDGVETERVRWLWEGRIPLGMLTLLVGDPGLGKSLLTARLAGWVSKAGGDVLLLSAEDHKAATIRPRLETVGADLARVHALEVRRDGIDEGIALPDDGAELQRIAEAKGARLVVVDPLMAHLPESVNSWRDQSVRRALAPLHRLAEDLQCAVVIVAHLNKAKGADATHRTGGSIAIPAAVRSALLLARDPEDPEPEIGAQRVLAHFKCNVAPLAETLTATIETAEVDGGHEAPRLDLVGTSTASAADLLDAPTEEARTERDEAIEFLEAELAEGPKPTHEVTDAARGQIAPRTLTRAKADLGVISTKDGLNGGWRWRLPKDATVPEPPVKDASEWQGCQGDISEVAPFDQQANWLEDQGEKEGQGCHPSEIGTLDAAAPADEEAPA